MHIASFLPFLFAGIIAFNTRTELAFGNTDRQPVTTAQPVPSDTTYKKADMVNFDDYLKLATEVQEYRKDRLVSFAEFQQMASEPNTVILDTRSKKMYDAEHLKGAIHLNFSDFNVWSLQKLIPSKDTRILIYCNNNFRYTGSSIDIAAQSFVSKMAPPAIRNEVVIPGITMALNIPTFINLYGYGYLNVYELGEELLIVEGQNNSLLFDGTTVKRSGSK